MESRPLRIEPEGVKVTEDPTEGISISNESCNVLHEDVSGSYCANDVSHPRPSPTLVGGAELSASDRERLARESPADDIDSRAGLAEPPLRSGSDVVMAGYLRPVSGQHALAVGVELDLPDGGHAGALQAELDATDAGEQR